MQVEKRLIPWETRLRYDAFVIGLFALASTFGTLNFREIMFDPES